MIKVKIGNRIISHDTQPYIIAEVGVNHECSLINAKRLILNAKLGGADCVKFQTYKAELIASKFAPAYWDIKKEKTNNFFSLDFICKRETVAIILSVISHFVTHFWLIAIICDKQ
jgi:sialic acid synthase SpsE